MRFSIVTISFNQVDFLERALLSVLQQDGVDFEYIVVDPGSVDGSRDIIERYRRHLAHVLYEKDDGPADGLNRGFALATGDIYAYLNSDDTFEAKALFRVAQCFREHPELDVICGHAWVTDSHDNRLRRVWSERFRRWSVAYGASIQIQPSTFIRRAAFRRSGGFNVQNRTNWDGELLVDLFNTGATIGVFDEFLSTYRLHDLSITSSGSTANLMGIWNDRRFKKLMDRPFRQSDRGLAHLHRLWKHATHPRASLERLMHGPLYLRETVKR